MLATSPETRSEQVPPYGRKVAFPSESCLGFSGSLWRRTNGVLRLYSLSFLPATSGECVVGSGRIAGLGESLPRLERTDHSGVLSAERRVAPARRPRTYYEDR